MGLVPQKFLRRNLQWLSRLVMSASLAVHVQTAAPLPAFLRVMASSRSMLMSASPAVTAQTYALLALPLRNNLE